MRSRNAKFGIGQVVKHRFYPFRGVIFDVDPVFANTEEWWRSIPAEVRPAKEQPFYHLYAENEDSQYVAYVSEQNLMSDESGEPVQHPQVSEAFERTAGRQILRPRPPAPELKTSMGGALAQSARGANPLYFAGAAGAGAAGAGAPGAPTPLCSCSSFLRCSSAFFCSCCCNARRCCSRTLGSVGLPS